MKKIILLNGKKRSGKDFTADLLVNKKFTKISVAEKLKNIACRIADVSYDKIEDLKNNNQSFNVDKDLFVIRFEKELKQLWEKEYSFLKKLNYQDISKIFLTEENVNGTYKINARKFLQDINIFKIIFNDEDIWIKFTI